MAPKPVSFIAQSLSRLYRPAKKIDTNENVEDIETLSNNMSLNSRPTVSTVASGPVVTPNIINNPPSGPIVPRPPPGALPSALLSGPRGPQYGPLRSGGTPPFGSQYQMVPPVSMPTQPLQSVQSMTMVPPVTMSAPPRMVEHKLPVAGVSLKDDSIECPHPTSGSPAVIVYETRQGNVVKPPPPATSEYIVKDTGNCSPRYMRCTLNQIPSTADLLKLSGMTLALIVQPLALPHPSEDPIQVIDFGENGPVRCSCCKGYMNPSVEFIDHGKRFICNLCGIKNETPREYYCNLGPDGRRLDADERPELCRGTIEFVASKEFMMRDLMPPVHFFLVDVSMNAIQTGATVAACSAIKQVISDLPEGPQTMVGIATYDSSIQFYNLKPTLQQPLMLVVADTQDVYTPLPTDIIATLYECRQNLEQLLENIPTMFKSNHIADSAFGAAIKAASLAMKTTGGKLLVFQSVLPSVGIGTLTARENEGMCNISSGKNEHHKLLQPVDKFLNELALELAEYQVCVDIFITTQTYVDVASISVISKTTGGQIYYYYPFSAVLHSAKVYNDLRWNITRPQGFEATMRVRCSEGLQVQEYSGNFSKRGPPDVDLPGIDCDKSIMVTLKLEDKFHEGSECAFQCALLYTTVDGQRRIRVSTLSLPYTNVLKNLFLSADLDTQLSCLLKQVANEIPNSSTLKVRDDLTNFCISISRSYSKICEEVSSSVIKVFPETLKLMPLFVLALIKSTGLQTSKRIDDRSYWISRVSSISTSLAVVLVYPRMIAIHTLLSKGTDGSLTTPTISLSREHITEDGIFLLENGEDALMYVGDKVDSYLLSQIFGAALTYFSFQQYDNPLSKKLNDLINGIRRLRSSYLCLQLCKKGDPLGMQFHSYMIEDRNPETLSYRDFLLHIHKQVQAKLC